MKVLLACGGTGGHIFPGVALAEEFQERMKDVEIVFVGTPRGLEKEILGKGYWRLEMIQTPSFVDKSSLKKISALFDLLKAFFFCLRLVRKESPHLVIAVGGYVAVPVIMAGFFLRKPTFTVEPNAVPGKANLLLKFFVKKVFVGFEGMEKFFGAKKTKFFGTPVRKNLLQNFDIPKSGKKVILVMGGSLGAQKINQAILSVLPRLAPVKDKIHFIHQIGQVGQVGQMGRGASVQEVEKQYLENRISAEVYPFIEEIGPLYARADFVIARAGAITVAELKAIHKPSLLIPYPSSANQHQVANARALQQEGGAKVMLESELSSEVLAKVIEEVAMSEGFLEAMRKNLSKFGGAHAAPKIVTECLQYI